MAIRKHSGAGADDVSPSYDDLVDEFAKTALTALLMDPDINPRNQTAFNTVVDFVWTIAITAVERMPPDGLRAVEFVQAGLCRALQDPRVNPRNQDALEAGVDWAWSVAITMADAQPDRRFGFGAAALAGTLLDSNVSVDDAGMATATAFSWAIDAALPQRRPAVRQQVH